ncbi:hypothetical protein RB653_000685 [Dictyostelium firmibasis]|uniref:Uncharacterized protein n=1 Tax=Dictyostelium firmibasis TaxID=79012 RepID=A0AAN7U2P9_9MYCE
MSSENTLNNPKTNTIQLEAPKGCDYVDLKDFLVFSRKDNDNFIYEVNKIKNEDRYSECEKVWNTLEAKQLLRSQLILNCIEETKKEIESLNTPTITTTIINNKNNNNINIKNQGNSIDESEKRKLTTKLNMLNMELEVESILIAAAKKVFHKVCK